MKVAFIMRNEEGMEFPATYGGELIVATSVKEIVNGPSRRVMDLSTDIITVTDWIGEQTDAG